MPCHLRTSSLFSTQNHTQPATTLNWAKLDTFQACERIRPFRCGSSIGMQHPKHAPDHLCKLIFSFLFFSSKIKRQKDAITPQRSRLCACAGCHVTHRSGRRTTGFKIAPNFTSGCGIGWYSYRPFLSSERAIHLYVFAHFHDTIVHIMLILPRLWFKKSHLEIPWNTLKRMRQLQNNLFTFFVCMQRFLEFLEYRVGFFNLFYQFNKSGNLKCPSSLMEQHLWRCSY